MANRVKTDSAGAFTSDYMKPGTYTMSRKFSQYTRNPLMRRLLVHKSELVVASQSITVTAGGLVTSNIASTEAVTLYRHLAVTSIVTFPS